MFNEMHERKSREAYSIQDFCDAHGLSRGMFYVLRKAGKGPRLMKVGRRVLITRASAEAWRVSMERASQ